jgi:hypothetical protein
MLTETKVRELLDEVNREIAEVQEDGRANGRSRFPALYLTLTARAEVLREILEVQP